MYKKIATVIFISIILIFAACNAKDDLLTICKAEPFNSYIDKSEVTVTDTLYVYHKDGYVTKTVLIEENVLINGGIEELRSYAEIINQSFESEILQAKGYEYSYELTDTSYTWETTYDYTQMDIKEELDTGKELFHIMAFIDENYKISYDQVIAAYTESGWVCEEVK